MEFGPRFKKLLEKNNVSQKKFAEDTKTHKGLVSTYLNGKEKPSSDFIFKAIKYFPGVDANYFFDETVKSDMINEPSALYQSENPEKIIEEIEVRLNKIKRFLSQK